MPVNEAVELEQAASDKLGVGLGTTFVNHRMKSLPVGLLDRMAPALTIDAPGKEVWEALEIREGKVRAGDKHLERLPARMLRDVADLPILTEPRLGPEQLQRVVPLVAPALAPKKGAAS